MRNKALLLILAALALVAGLWLQRPGSESQGNESSPGAGPAAARALPGDAPGGQATLTAATETGAGPVLGAERSLASAAGLTAEPEVAGTDLSNPGAARFVRGRVLDGAGRPVPAARVIKGASGREGFGFWSGADQPPARLERQTDADGRFELPWPSVQDRPQGPSFPGAGSRLEVRAPGCAPLKHSLQLPPSGDLDVGDLVLGPGLMLSGRVLDHAGAPVAGARLFARVPSNSEFSFPWASRSYPDATSNERGEFELTSLEYSPYSVSVEHSSHASKEFSGELPQQGRSISGVVFELDRPAAIAGTVTGLPSGASDLEVRARRLETGGSLFGGLPERRAALQTGGRFRLEGLDAKSRYELTVGRAAKSGAEFDFGESMLSHAEAKQVPAGSEGVELAYLPGARLCLQVVDSATGAPIERYKASVQRGLGGRQRGEKDDGPHADGRVCIEDLRSPPKNQGFFFPDPKVDLTAEGYRDLSVPLPALEAGQVVDLGVLRLEPVPRLTVTVVDDSSGRPVPDVQVELSADPGINRAGAQFAEMSFDSSEGLEMINPGEGVRSQQAKTDAAGQVQFNTFSEARGMLTARHPDFAPAELRDLELDIQQASQLELRLSRGGSVRVLALDASGAPLVGAVVESRPAKAAAGRAGFPNFERRGETTQPTDNQGVAMLEHLPPGDHRVWLRDVRPEQEGPMFFVLDGQEQQEIGELVTINEGQLSEVTLRASPKGRLEGRILESGAVLPGATVQLQKTGGAPDPFMFLSGPSGRCDGNGRFKIENLDLGEYTARISAPSRASVHELPTRIEIGENRLDLDLSVSILEGRVVNTKGQPMEGVTVSAIPIKAQTEEGQVITSAFVMGGGGFASFSSGSQEGSAVRTDADGRYLLRGVQAGKPIEVHAKPGQEHPFAQSGQSEEITAEEGRSKQVPDLVLSEGGELLLRVIGGDGQPVSPGFANLRPKDPEGAFDPNFQMLDSDGQARFTGLTPGTWVATVQRLAATPGVDNSVDKEFEVLPGEVQSGLIELP